MFQSRSTPLCFSIVAGVGIARLTTDDARWRVCKLLDSWSTGLLAGSVSLAGDTCTRDALWVSARQRRVRHRMIRELTHCLTVANPNESNGELRAKCLAAHHTVQCRASHSGRAGSKGGPRQKGGRAHFSSKESRYDGTGSCCGSLCAARV